MKIISDNQPLNQSRLAADLFLAMGKADIGEILRLAPLIHELDSHVHGASEESPLLVAARHDLPLEVFELLLPRSNPKKTNAEGATALILAAWGAEADSAEIVRLLLPVSDPLAAMHGTESALHCALSSGILESVAALLPHSDLEQRNGDDETPLENAIDISGSFGAAAANLIREELARRESQELSLSASIAESSAQRSPRL